MKYQISTAFFFLFFTTLLSAQANADVCWKPSYGRGVGTVPDTCDKVSQTKSGLLCYVKPKEGQTNVAGVVWQDCPVGWQSQGAFCRKPSPSEYGRGAGYPWKFGDAFNLEGARSRCAKDNRQGCEQSGLVIYPKCGPGYHPVGCCMCSRDCVQGMADAGVSCTKQTYVVSPITPTCDATKQYDAGLCYKKCETEYNGVGPVCWGNCPKGMVDCGAMCGKSATDCAEAIGTQIWATGKLLLKLAEFAATLGASTSISSAIEVAINSAADAAKEFAKNALKDLAKKMTKEQALKELSKIPGIPADIADNMASMAGDPENFDYKSLLTNADPTGIAKVVNSFNIGICKMDKAIPKDAPIIAPKDVVPNNACSKMQMQPDYAELINKKAWTTADLRRGIAIVNDAIRMQPNITTFVEPAKILKMNCEAIVRDPQYHAVVNTPIEKWGKDHPRNTAIVIFGKGVDLTLARRQGIKSPEILKFLQAVGARN